MIVGGPPNDFIDDTRVILAEVLHDFGMIGIMRVGSGVSTGIKTWDATAGLPRPVCSSPTGELGIASWVAFAVALAITQKRAVLMEVRRGRETRCSS
jgi:hypothetical protein